MIKFGVFFTTALCVTAFSVNAFACKCERDSKEASYKSSKAVFFGKTNEDGTTIKVVKAFKGTKKKRTLKLVVDDSCDMTFTGDKTYMVFASFTDKKKKSIRVSSCSASEQLDYQPLSATAWSYSEELPYGTSRSRVKTYTDQRAKLERVAMTQLTKAAKKCDKKTWAGKEKVTAHLKVRFDVEPTGEFQTVLIDVKPKDDENPIDTCLQEQLAKARFRKFSGGPISVRTYWVLNRIDRQLKQEKRRSQVIPYQNTDEDDEL